MPHLSKFSIMFFILTIFLIFVVYFMLVSTQVYLSSINKFSSKNSLSFPLENNLEQF